MDRTQHWENVYQTKNSTEVSWYEPDPKQSLDLILQVAGESLGRVLDVGGGQSFLVDRLLDAGFTHVAVLDISQTAIEATKARLGERSSQVEWIVADITQAQVIGRVRRLARSCGLSLHHRSRRSEALRGIAETILASRRTLRRWNLCQGWS